MIWIRIGSMAMFVGVALGAFGAHALRARLDASALDIYKTGVFYHLIHALALLVVGCLTQYVSEPKIGIAGICFLTGIVMFSGSLYLLAVTGVRQWGMMTPLGGLAFLAGWLLIVWVTWS